MLLFKGEDLKLKSELIGWIFGSVLAIVLGMAYYSSIISPFLNKTSIEDSGYQIFLNRWVNGINQSCPAQITESIRLDSCATSHLQVRYNYTLSYDLSSIMTKESIDVMSDNLLSQVKSDPSLNGMRNNDVTFLYRYNDINGMLLFEVLITPQDYQKN